MRLAYSFWRCGGSGVSRRLPCHKKDRSRQQSHAWRLNPAKEAAARAQCCNWWDMVKAQQTPAVSAGLAVKVNVLRALRERVSYNVVLLRQR